MRPFGLSRRADRDIESASDWYARVSARLALEFFEDVYQAIDVARERPTSCPETRRGVRRVLCKRFPYRVYFEINGERIDILAVYHTSRNEAAWDDPNRE